MPPLEKSREGFEYTAYKNRYVQQLYCNYPNEPNKKTTDSEMKCIMTKWRNKYLEEDLLTMGPSGENLYRSIGPLIESKPIAVDHSVGNHYRGIRKRVAHDIKMSYKELNRFTEFCNQYIRKHYTPLPYIEPSEEFLEQWLKHTKYTLKQKDMLRGEYRKFYDGKLSDHKFYRINSFIKKEFYEEMKEPRTINAPSNAMKAVLGPYIHEIEKIVFDEHFIKHLTPSQVAEKLKRISIGYSMIYETDYSSFEGTFSTFIMRACELALFKHLLANNKMIYKMIKKADMSERDVYFRNGISHCKFTGSRLSGALWTSLGNGFTNKMLVEYVAYRTRKRGFSFDYLVEGDDGFIATSLPLRWELVQRLGFRLKCDSRHNINDVSFCGICIGPQGLVPDIKRTLKHFGYTFDNYLVNNKGVSKRYLKREKEMIRAKAMSLLATSKATPILQPLALKLIELTEGVHVRLKDFDWWEINVVDILSENLQPIDISQESYKFVEEHLKISQKDIMDIEYLISEMTDYHVILPLVL